MHTTEHKDRFFVVIWPKKAVRIDPFSPKNQHIDPKHKIPKNQLEKLNRFHYYQISKFWVFKSALLLLDQFWANIRQFFWAKSLKKHVFLLMRNYKEIFTSEFAKKISLLRPYGFDYLRFLTNARRGALRLKTQ